MSDKFRKIYGDVSAFLPFEGDRIVIKKGLDYKRHKLLMFNSETGTESNITQEGDYQLQELYSNLNNYWVRTWYSKSIIIYPVTNTFEEVELLICDSISPSKILGIIKDESKTKNFALYNIKTKEFDWKYEESSTLYKVIDHSLIFISFQNDKKRISKIDINSGEHLWSYNLLSDEDFYIEKIHDKYEDGIILSSSIGDLIILDFETGIRKKHIQTTCPSFYTAIYHEHKITLLTNQKYFQVDLTTSEAIEIEIKDLYFSSQIAVPNRTDLFYFVANSKDTDYINHLVGTIDTSEQKIVWIDKIDLPEEDNIKEIKELGSKLYILTTKGVLFEKYG